MRTGTQQVCVLDTASPTVVPTTEVGVYTAGWAKRGPTGVVATNVGDARETVASLMEDVQVREIYINIYLFNVYNSIRLTYNLYIIKPFGSSGWLAK